MSARASATRPARSRPPTAPPCASPPPRRRPAACRPTDPTFSETSMKRALCAAAFGPAGPSPARPAAAEVAHAAPPASPIAALVAVPPGYGTVYVSGMTPPVLDAKAAPGSTAMYGDTQTQTLGVLKRLQEALQ